MTAFLSENLICINNEVLLTSEKIMQNRNIIESVFPELIFSESYWGIQFKCISNDKRLEIRIYAVNRKKLLQLPSNIRKIEEYCVIDNQILHFDGNSRTILANLKKAGIADFNSLSIRNLVQLEEILAIEGNFLSDKKELREYLGKCEIESRESFKKLPIPAYKYQLIGAEWILSNYECSNSGVLLADVMGLGKTLQSILVVADLVEKVSANRLIVCPNTLVENWKREIRKFSPNLKVLVHRGNWRFGVVSRLEGYDLIITTYETLVSDIDLLSSIKWEVVIIDEAQQIKNPLARRTIACKRLISDFRIAVTGTPVENSILDAWSIIDFLQPNFLGSLKEFEISMKSSGFDVNEFHKIISRFIIRRDLIDVGSQLPPMTLQNHVLEWPEELDRIYEETRKNAIKEFKRSGGLVATTRLRKLTTHPILCDLNVSSLSELSPKYRLLHQIIGDLFANGDKALVFVSYNEMISLIVRDFREKYPESFVGYLTGNVEVDSRQNLVEEFNNWKGNGLLVCNVIVAGAGLNITGANHVIHYNLEWNPAKEDQASFRVYRPGQLKNVFIHRFFYAHTIDEIIDERISSKRNLAENVVDGSLTDEDFAAALEVTPIDFRKINN